MRTTLTLDPDVSHMLEDWRSREHLTLKEAVNQALREGLARKQAGAPAVVPFQTGVVDLGKCRVPCLDSISNALSQAEGETFR